jgi:hypothetical protein
MSVVISIVSLLIVSLLSVGLFLWGVLNIIRDLPELGCQGGPSFHEISPIYDGPICNDAMTDTHQARSQFAWQSRSHFRAPD